MSLRSSFSSCSGYVSVTRTRGCHPSEAGIVVETPLHRVFLEDDVSMGQLDYLVRYIRRCGVRPVVGDLDFVESVMFRVRKVQGYREELAQIE